MFLVRLGASGGQDHAMHTAVGARGVYARDSAVVECQVCPQSTAATLIHPPCCIAGDRYRSPPSRPAWEISPVTFIPQVPCSPAGSLVRSHPSFHSPVPGTLLGVEKKNRSYKKLKKPSAQGAQTLSKTTVGLSKPIQSSKSPRPPSQRLLRPWTD